MYTLGGISLSVFLLRFVVFTFEESPKFLLSKGKDEEAIAVLQSIAKTNKRECQITLDTFAELEDASGVQDSGGGNAKTTFKEKAHAEGRRLRTLFSSATLTRLTILVWIIYAFDYWGFSVAGKLPQLSISIHTLRLTHLQELFYPQFSNERTPQSMLVSQKPIATT